MLISLCVAFKGLHGSIKIFLKLEIKKLKTGEHSVEKLKILVGIDHCYKK